MHDLQLLAVPSLSQVCGRVHPPTPHFGLLLVATDWSDDVDGVAAAVEDLSRGGLAWLSVWGNGCERIHDIADDVLCARDDWSTPTDAVVMTTWHDDESLEDTLEFFRIAAWPADAFVKTCGTWVVVVVGSQDLESQVRALT